MDNQVILKSLMASFKIEGIDIPLNIAEQTLKKVELKRKRIVKKPKLVWSTLKK